MKLAERDALLPEWIKRLHVGDVLKTDTGDYRVVRAIKPRRGYPFYIEFAIRHCSWTTRATTVKTRSELFRWQPTGFRLKLDKPIDAAIAADCEDSRQHKLTCCDVEGVP